MKIITDTVLVDKFFDHKIDQIYPTEKKLREKLLSGKRLKFYIGADATGPRLHIGHLIPILKMKQLQELGHEIIFLVGDFTARLGDPTDKSEVRRILSTEEVNSNASKFKTQIARYIDFDSGENPAQIAFNSKWNNNLTLSDVIKLASNTTVQQMIERDMFQKRLDMNKPIFLHEFLYPLIQGYDSVFMEVDGEFGGRDQTFNMLMGRTLLKNYKNIDKFVITTHFLLSSDGQNKMSKSIGNCIFIDDSPMDKFGKVMSIPDHLIGHYYRLATEELIADIEQIETNLEQGVDPMSIKKQLAYQITLINDGEEEAKKALEFFEKTIQNNEAPQSAPTFSRAKFDKVELTLKEIVTSTSNISNAEAKRLIRAGAIEINGAIETDLSKNFKTTSLDFLRIGKKNWINFID